MSSADWSDLHGRRPGGRSPQPRRPRRRLAGVTLGRVRHVIVSWLLPVLVAAGAAATVFVVWQAVQEGRLLPLQRVVLTAVPEQVEESDVRTAVGPYLHPSLLVVDVAGARAALEALPWVERARLRRAWSGALVVTLTERQATGVWREEALVDHNGALFVPEGFAPGGLPRLAGPKGTHKQVVELFQRLEQIFAETDVEVVALSLSPRGAWQAELVGGGTVALGRERPVERAERFAAVLPALRSRSEGRMKRIDLRYPNGFAVAWAAADATD